MSRPISSRIVVEGTLQAETPLHVGGMGSEPGVDLALAVDGQGRLYVPGTSLAGSLRSWMEQRAGEVLGNALWGYQKQDQGHASYIIVDDAVVTPPAGAAPEIRDGVGIDRVLGVAARMLKYTRAVLPRGSCLTFHLELELAPEKKGGDSSLQRHLLGRLLRSLEQGEIRLGAARTQGLGRVKVAAPGLRVVEHRLDRRAGMLQLLRGQGTTLSIASLLGEATPADWREPGRIDLELSWMPRQPVMSKADLDGLAVDMLPLVTTSRDGKLCLVLPGASLKGVLRSQAERIVRTLRSLPADRSTTWRQRFLRQVGGWDELVDLLFGAARPAAEEREKEHKKSGPQAGLAALTVGDCHGRTSIAPSAWQAVLAAKDEAELTTALRQAGLDGHQGRPGLQQAFHVAVDRWTGGAAEGFLYSVLEVHALPWEEIRLSVDVGRLPRKAQRPALALLLLVLRDLTEGRIALGFATGRGMGALRVEALSLLARGLGGTELAFLEEGTTGKAGGTVRTELIGSGQFHVPASWRPLLDEAWRDHVRVHAAAGTSVRPSEHRAVAGRAAEVTHG